MSLQVNKQLLRAAVPLAAVVPAVHPVTDVGSTCVSYLDGICVRIMCDDLPGPREAEADNEVGGREGEGGRGPGGLAPALEAPRLASLWASNSSR